MAGTGTIARRRQQHMLRARHGKGGCRRCVHLSVLEVSQCLLQQDVTNTLAKGDEIHAQEGRALDSLHVILTIVVENSELPLVRRPHLPKIVWCTWHRSCSPEQTRGLLQYVRKIIDEACTGTSNHRIQLSYTSTLGAMAVSIFNIPSTDIRSTLDTLGRDR